MLITDSIQWINNSLPCVTSRSDSDASLRQSWTHHDESLITHSQPGLPAFCKLQTTHLFQVFLRFKSLHFSRLTAVPVSETQYLSFLRYSALSFSMSWQTSSTYCFWPFAVVCACLPDLLQDVLGIDERSAVTDVVHNHKAICPVHRLLQYTPGLRALWPKTRFSSGNHNAKVKYGYV